MINIYKITLLILIDLLASSCAAYNKNNASASNSDLVFCEDPRPQICTREYNPVCATYNDGSKKTGSTGCTSCSDPEAIGYIMGACETATAD